ncbi:MAG: hypothetical protein ACFFCT_01850 [Candidatus Odinarchaeota archaeon]
MSSDNKRTDEYWMGVRDALRMVDSFNKWAARNPGRAKSLEDFIHDGLIAAAKRCESCLREKLGLSFVRDDEEDEIPDSLESTEPEVAPPSGYESIMTDDTEEPIDSVPDTTYEIAIESKDYDSSQEITIETDESPISIDAVERLGDEPIEDFVIDGPQRDFTTDFVLVEPPPLVVDSDEQQSVDEEQLEGPDLEELEDLEEITSESEISEKRSGFTWSEYEAAVTPTSEPEPPDTEYDEYMTADDDYFKEPLDEDDESYTEESLDTPPEPSEQPDVWSASKESSIGGGEILEEFNEDEDEGSIPEIDDTIAEESEEVQHSITEPPAPPPPPESEEDEEERKRRARRLFFGA